MILSKIKNFILDFDGVLVESLDIKSKGFYRIYSKYGNDIGSKVVMHHNNNLGMPRKEKFKYYHRFFLNKLLNDIELKSIESEFSKYIVDKIIKCKEVEGSIDFLENFKNNLNFWIVSATPDKELKYIIKKRNLSKFFKNCYGSNFNKPEAIEKIINIYNLDKNETAYIGDAFSDYKAAMKSNVFFIMRKTKGNFDSFNRVNGILKISNFKELKNIIYE